MPRLRTETYGTGDQSWLGSTHALRNARTETLDPAASGWVAGTHWPNGYIPSGTPVAKVSGVLVPYDKTEGTTTGAGILAGFLSIDVSIFGTAKVAAALVDHGRVKVAKVPYSGGFAAPAAAAKSAAVQFVFI